MARTPGEHKTPEYVVTDEDTPGLPALMDTANQMAAADLVVMESFDVIKALGRIETAQFWLTVGEKLIAETAIFIRDGKKYKGLPYKDENGNCRHVGSFQEFCEIFLGKSRQRVQELVSNYHLLGPDLYEQSERLGLRQRDYNAIKALPADDQAVIKQAIEAESRDKVIEILEEIIARNASEKAALKKRADELKASLDSSGERNANLNRRVGELEEQISTLKGRRSQETADERLLRLRDALSKSSEGIKAGIMTSLRKAIVDLKQLCDEQGAPEAQNTFIAGCLAEIVLEVNVLRNDFGIKDAPSDDPGPEWMTEEWHAKVARGEYQ
jgi:phage shock protein A